ncbi:MAG: LamG-like jellyroll fold domain-containing protein, partial [Anaerolineales bacterium]
NPTTKDGTAYQRVFNTDGTYNDYPVGSFYYHPIHDHYHFENWGQYQLWTQSEYDNYISSGGTQGEFNAVGAKTTSCVLDEELIQPLFDTPAHGIYPFEGCMPDSNTNILLEGLTPGWGDTYDYWRYEQWVDLGVNTLPDGNYVLRSVSDLYNNMYESAGKADPSRESTVDNEGITPFTVVGGQVIDSLPPSGTVYINNLEPSTSNPAVNVYVIGRDDVYAEVSGTPTKGVNQIFLSNDGNTWASYAFTNGGTSTAQKVTGWDLTNPTYGGNSSFGIKTVYVKLHDFSGKFSPVYTDTIAYGPIPATSQYSGEVLADNPAGYWRLGEAAGKTAIDNQSQNHGTYQNTPTQGATSLITSDIQNTSVSFDGINDYVSLGNSSLFNPQTTITLEAWIVPTVIPTSGNFASVLTRSGSYTIQFNGPKLEFAVIQNNVKQRLQAPAGFIVAGSKYHIVTTYDGTYLKMYVNGNLIGTLQYIGIMSPSSNNINIGTWDGTGEYFKGTIDEVAIYNSVLSLQRIQAHYAAGEGIVAPNAQIDTKPASITNSTTANFTFSNTGPTSTYECSFDNAAFSACTSPIQYTSLADGQHTFQVRAKDSNLPWNIDQTPASFSWVVDTVAPSVSSITRVSISPTASANVKFTILFPEAVTGLSASDLSLTTSGLTGAKITNVSGSGTTYTVTANVGSGSGTIRLNLIDDDTILDAASNPVGGVGAGNGNFITGETYTITKQYPLLPAPKVPATQLRLLTNDSTPNLIWNTIPNAQSYEIEIATDKAFTNIVTTQAGITSLPYTIGSPLADGIYYWHVRAYNLSSAPGKFSIMQTLTVDTTAPPVPTLLAPTDGATSKTAPSLKWSTSTGAAGYEVQIDNNNDLLSPEIKNQQVLLDIT